MASKRGGPRERRRYSDGVERQGHSEAYDAYDAYDANYSRYDEDPQPAGAHRNNPSSESERAYHGSAHQLAPHATHDYQLPTPPSQSNYHIPSNVQARPYSPRYSIDDSYTGTIPQKYGYYLTPEPSYHSEPRHYGPRGEPYPRAEHGQRNPPNFASPPIIRVSHESDDDSFYPTATAIKELQAELKHVKEDLEGLKHAKGDLEYLQDQVHELTRVVERQREDWGHELKGIHNENKSLQAASSKALNENVLLNRLANDAMKASDEARSKVTSCEEQYEQLLEELRSSQKRAEEDRERWFAEFRILEAPIRDTSDTKKPPMTSDESRGQSFGRTLPFIFAKEGDTDLASEGGWEKRRSFSYIGSSDPSSSPSSSNSARGLGHRSVEGYELDLTFEPGEEFAKKRVSGLVQWLWNSYNRFRSHPTGSDNRSGAGEYSGGKRDGAPVTSSTGNSETTKSNPRQKRVRGSNNGEEEDGGEPGQHKRLRVAQKRKKETPPFACPFFKFDRCRHNDCGDKVLNGISRVTQHFGRCHRIPLHCSSCFLVFRYDEDRGEHERQRTCVPVSPVTWDGRINSKKREEIRDSIKKNKSAEENWYAIFECLFPGAMRPDNPYPDVVNSGEMSQFRGFVTSRAIQVVDEYLQHESVTDPDILNLDGRDLLERAIPHLLNMLFERFNSAQTSASRDNDASNDMTTGNPDVDSTEGTMLTPSNSNEDQSRGLNDEVLEPLSLSDYPEFDWYFDGDALDIDIPTSSGQ